MCEQVVVTLCVVRPDGQVDPRAQQHFCYVQVGFPCAMWTMCVWDACNVHVDETRGYLPRGILTGPFNAPGRE